MNHTINRRVSVGLCLICVVTVPSTQALPSVTTSKILPWVWKNKKCSPDIASKVNNVTLRQENSTATTINDEIYNVSNSNTTSVMRILETELWDGQQWQSSLSPSSPFSSLSCWTTVTGSVTNPPDQTNTTLWSFFCWRLENRYQFYSRHSWLGIYSQHNAVLPPLLRRIWLRNLQPDSKTTIPNSRSRSKMKPPLTDIVTTKNGSEIIVAINKARRKKNLFLFSFINAIAKDFKFKGFGYSFYKSLISSSIGFTFRVPLTYHFQFWERKKSTPSLSASASIFYPWCVTFSLSGSARLEAVHWTLARTLQWLQYIVLWVFWMYCRAFY